jgi:hypothetical protein
MAQLSPDAEVALRLLDVKVGRHSVLLRKNHRFDASGAWAQSPEVTATSALLTAAAFHIGQSCKPVNDKFMHCKKMHFNDPYKCVDDGLAVTACTIDLYVVCVYVYDCLSVSVCL